MGETLPPICRFTGSMARGRYRSFFILRLQAKNKELEALLRTCESSRYAQTDSSGDEETELAQRARVLLGPLDRLRPVKGDRS